MSIKLITQGVRGKHSHEYESQTDAVKAIRTAHNRTGQLLIAIRPSGNNWIIQLGYPTVKANGRDVCTYAYDGQILKV